MAVPTTSPLSSMVARHVEPAMTREGVDAAGRGDQQDGGKSERFRLSKAGPTRHGTRPPYALAHSWRSIARMQHPSFASVRLGSNRSEVRSSPRARTHLYRTFMAWTQAVRTGVSGRRADLPYVRPDRPLMTPEPSFLAPLTCSPSRSNVRERCQGPGAARLNAHRLLHHGFKLGHGARASDHGRGHCAGGVV